MWPPRAGAVKDGRRCDLAVWYAISRPRLDGTEPGGMMRCVGIICVVQVFSLELDW